MDQWVKARVQPDDLSSVSVIHMVGENQLLQGYLVNAWDEFIQACTHAHMHARVHTHSLNKCDNFFFDAVVRISVPKDPTSY